MKLIQELTFSQHNADRLILVVAPFFLNFLFFYLNHNNIKILSSLALLSCCKLINCDWRKKEQRICQPKDHFQKRNDVFPIASPGYGDTGYFQFVYTLKLEATTTVFSVVKFPYLLGLKLQ